MISILDKVRESTALAARNAKHVAIDREAAQAYAESMGSEFSRPPEWDRELQFSDRSAKTAEWIFVLDSINFSFWPDSGKERWTFDYAGRRHRGYFALSCALKKAVEDGIPVCDAQFLLGAGEEEIGGILGGNGPIPMLEERAAILRENAGILLKKHRGSFAEFLRKCGPSASAVVERIWEDFPTFRDAAIRDGRKIFFLKRAQILVSDLWGAFGGKGPGGFQDMEELTAFADYRLPQLLRALGILKYGESLAAKVDAGVLLDNGGEEEIEIRAATVQAVELIAGVLRCDGIAATSFGVDWRLWADSHKPEYNARPYHHTRTIWY